LTCRPFFSSCTHTHTHRHADTHLQTTFLTPSLRFTHNYCDSAAIRIKLNPPYRITPAVTGPASTVLPAVAMPAIRGAKSKKKTRRHTRDLDQIHADVQSERHLELYKETKMAEELPGLGQWYCLPCAKWFDAETNFEHHKRGKPHKRRYAASLFVCSFVVPSYTVQEQGARRRPAHTKGSRRGGRTWKSRQWAVS
jgi:hypothetical protein